MELVTQVSITWVSLKWLVAAMVLEAEWSRVWEIPLLLTPWNCDIAQRTGGTRPRILLTTFWTEKAPNAKLPFQCSLGRYEGSHSDCILLATNGDIQAINTKSSNGHINLHTVQKVDRGKGKWLKVWRYLSYSPPENRRPLQLQEVQLGRSTDREERAWQAGRTRSTFLPLLFHHSHCNLKAVRLL